MQRILVIKSRHIGDVLLTAPLIAALAERYPGAAIRALVKPGTEAMLTGHPDLERVELFQDRRAGEGRAAYAWRFAGWLWRLRRWGCDWAISTTEGDRGIITAFLSGAKRRTAVMRERDRKWWRVLLLTDISPVRSGWRHTVVRNLDLLGEAPPSVAGRTVRLTHGVEEAATVEALLRAAGWDGTRPLVQVHPTSRWFFKCWSDAAMAGVMDWLAERGLGVVLTAAPDPRELEKAVAIRALCRHAPLDLSGRLSLKQLAALSSRCRLFFGVDTAPMHMAAALDVPVVALFGPSGSFDWGPWPNGWLGEATPYPQRNGVQRAGPHVVVQAPWSCAPCGGDGCEGSKRSRCLEELSVAEVLPHLQESLVRLGL